MGAGRLNKLPVTILSGFLGAGKSTLLKRILQNTRAQKVSTSALDTQTAMHFHCAGAGWPGTQASQCGHDWSCSVPVLAAACQSMD